MAEPLFLCVICSGQAFSIAQHIVQRGHEKICAMYGRLWTEGYVERGPRIAYCKGIDDF